MSLIDKASGKAKEAIGDATDDPKLRDKGRKENAKGEAKEEQVRAEEQADAASERADTLDKQT